MAGPALAVLNDRYELRGLVGGGGMAEVYRGFDRVLQREVAVKLMRAALAGEVERLRFDSETRLLATLNHPHLVTLLDAGVDDVDGTPRPWIVMELVPGPTLASRIAEGPMPPAEVADVGADLASALALVHAQGVVHRDMKPANVLLTTHGEAKLADFGIARLMDEQTHLTAADHTIGTAAYLAPEQVRGEQVTGACDVYALGLVLLEALTGQRAYTGTPTEAAFARLHQRPLIPVSLGAPWIRLLDAMTALEPGERPDAGQVVADLKALRLDAAPPVAAAGWADLGSTGTMSLPTASTAAATKRRRRRPVLVVAGALALAALLAGLVWLAGGGTDPSSPPASAVGPRPAAAHVSTGPAKSDATPTATPSTAVTRADRPHRVTRHHHHTAHHTTTTHKTRHHKGPGKGHGHAHGKGHRHKR